MAPTGVTAPVVRFTLASVSFVCPASLSTATPEPLAGVLAVATLMPGAMSKPSTASTGELNVWHSVCVPAFGGFWMHSASVVRSSVYCVVTVLLAELLVYAVSWTPLVGPLMPPSMFKRAAGGAVDECAVVGIDAEVLAGAVDHAHAIDGRIEVHAERGAGANSHGHRRHSIRGNERAGGADRRCNSRGRGNRVELHGARARVVAEAVEESVLRPAIDADERVARVESRQRQRCFEPGREGGRDGGNAVAVDQHMRVRGRGRDLLRVGVAVAAGRVGRRHRERVSRPRPWECRRKRRSSHSASFPVAVRPR